MLALGLALAALIGLSLGLLGGGGSILTVPILVYVLGYGAKPAIAMSLPVVGATSLAGAIGHWRAGRVRWRVALTFGVVAMVGAYGGARLARHVAGPVQLALLAAVMVGASLSMLRSARRTGAVEEAATRPPAPAMIALVAAGVGVLTGLVGIGGGFLVVPALVVFGGLTMKEAVGTSLLVIAMNSASGFAGYAGQVAIPWGFLTAFTSVAIAGILVGTWLVRYVSPRALKQAFAVFLLVMGAVMLWRNRGAIAPPRPTVAPATVR